MNEKLIHEKEKAYFILCLLTSIFVYASLVISLFGIVYIVIGFLVAILVNGLMIGHLKNNGVKLTDNQFSTTYQKVRQLSDAMDLKEVPDVFIIQENGLLNAFATRFFGRNFVVLYSDLFEMIETGNDDEIHFVIAHELAHIKRNHMLKSSLILPAMWIPFLGSAYSRSCELTCDRIAAAYTKDQAASIQALTILAVGKTLFKQIDVDDYIHSAATEKGFFVQYNKVISSHPPLPFRIKELMNFYEFPELFGLTKLHVTLEKSIP